MTRPFALQSLPWRPLAPLALLLALASGGCVGDQITFANPGPGPSSQDDQPDDTPLPTGGACLLDVDCPGQQECCRGRCVEDGACDIPLCQQQNDACRLTGTSAIDPQGDFLCTLFNQNDDPVCLGLCEQPFSAGGCAPGSWCLSVNAGEQAINLCVPTECRDHDDCRQAGPDGGTCVPFGNRTGFCFAAGRVGRGDPCRPSSGSAAESCGPGLYCVGEASGSTCQPLCDMWQGLDPCGVGRTCGYLTLGTGVCRSRTAEGRQPGEVCDPPGAWCGPGSQCLDFRAGGESLPACTAYCRPSADDCRGPLQERHGSCSTIFSDGNGGTVEDIGLCL